MAVERRSRQAMAIFVWKQPELFVRWRNLGWVNLRHQFHHCDPERLDHYVYRQSGEWVN